MKHTLTKLLTLCLALILATALLSFGIGAEQNTFVTVTIAVRGELAIIQKSVLVTDADGDGALTVNDALICAHQEYYDGGADAGYGYYQSEYGLSMSKLWGDESGMYGYYLNNASCMSLADPIKNDDHIVAFVYKNSDYSDIYCYFIGRDGGGHVGESTTVVLMAHGYDENWNSITYPLEGATITMDGVPTDYVTNEKGEATISLNETGSWWLGAISDAQTLVPPAQRFTVIKPESNDTENTDTEKQTTEEQTTAEQPTEEQTTQAPEQPGCKAIVGAGLIALLPLACLCIKRKEK